MNGIRVSFFAGLFLSILSVAEPYIEGVTFPDRTICGVNEMTSMSTENDAMKSFGKPIGIYRVGNMSCTGTLIAKDLFLTNRHCAGNCSNIKVTFGYLGNSPSETFTCKEIVEVGGGSANQDYMVVRLNGDPGIGWGWYDPSDREVSNGQPLVMIHHPGGTPMKVSLKDCHYRRTSSGMVHHRCDSNPGSSGSSLIIPDFQKPQNSRIIGVHAMGGCNSSDSSTNSGPAMRHLMTISPTLKSLAKP